jgi:hypothetical protein
MFKLSISTGEERDIIEDAPSTNRCFSGQPFFIRSSATLVVVACVFQKNRNLRRASMLPRRVIASKPGEAYILI